MAAFSVFFVQSPSFLSHQRLLEQGHGCSNCTGLFGMTKIPSDNHIRAMLDGAQPSLLQPAFDDVLTALQQAPGGLDVFRRLGDHLLIAFDGTEYFCSEAIHCPQCSRRRRSASVDPRCDARDCVQRGALSPRSTRWVSITACQASVMDAKTLRSFASRMAPCYGETAPRRP